MTLDQPTIDALAKRLEGCQLERRETHKITDDHPGMDWEDAYAIQAAILARKLARGQRLVGLKAGTDFLRQDEADGCGFTRVRLHDRRLPRRAWRRDTHE